MHKTYVIEVGDEQVGLVIREDGDHDFQFHAATPAYHALEGRHFSDPYGAERAAIAYAISRRNRLPGQQAQRTGGVL
ncbi:MAG: hypothetical protein K2X41_01660 [Hyphomicrobium sp.]|nr:hypothetical protein [Hyphomicrobium sp.]